MDMPIRGSSFRSVTAVLCGVDHESRVPESDTSDHCLSVAGNPLGFAGILYLQFTVYRSRSRSCRCRCFVIVLVFQKQ